MSDGWNAILTYLLAPVSVVAGIGLVAKWLLEKTGDGILQQLEARNEKQLKEIEAKGNEQLERLKSHLEDQRNHATETRLELSERRKYVRQVLRSVAGSTTDAVEDLRNRLHNILRRDLYQALEPGFDERPEAHKSGWSMTHRYAMESTLYKFARYFALRLRLRAQLGEDFFSHKADRNELVVALHECNAPLQSYPYSELEGLGVEAEDAQVFTSQQDEIGALVVWREKEGVRFREYDEFRRLLGAEPDTADIICPLRDLLSRAHPGSRVFRRLELFHENLGELTNSFYAIIDAAEAAVAAPAPHPPEEAEE